MMNYKYRIQVQVVLGLDDRGYEQAQEILDVKVEDLDIPELVRCIYNLEKTK